MSNRRIVNPFMSVPDVNFQLPNVEGFEVRELLGWREILVLVTSLVP